MILLNKLTKCHLTLFSGSLSQAIRIVFQVIYNLVPNTHFSFVHSTPKYWSLGYYPNRPVMLLFRAFVFIPLPRMLFPQIFASLRPSPSSRL